MEFTKEFIEQNGLSEEQVNAVSGFVQAEIVPNIKKEYDGKANENAEGILSGAAKYAKEKLGIEEDREQGEKWGDYFARISDTALTSKTQVLLEREKELEDKLKNFKGSDELKLKYEAELKKNDDLLKKVADLEPLKGYDQKYKEASEKLSVMQKEIAYNSVKPSFPDTVNTYEAKAKWGEFKKSVEDSYDIEVVDGVAYAIDKENIHKKVELSKLLEADSNITELLKGRQQGGLGSKPANLKNVDGVPFKVPQNATSEELTALVKEHTLKSFPDITSREYSSAFSEMYKKVKNAKK